MADIMDETVGVAHGAVGIEEDDRSTSHAKGSLDKLTYSCFHFIT